MIAGVLALPFVMSPLSPVSVRHALAVSPGTEYGVGYQTFETGGPYPEGLVIDGNGEILVGHEHGSIARLTLHANDKAVSDQTVAYTGGHSIGLVRDESNHTYWSATFPLGLQQVDSNGVMETIASVDGVALGFPDDVAIDRDGIIYVTDASTRYNPRTTKPGAPYVLWDFMEGRANGRLIAYDSEKRVAHTVLDNLSFPSGVALTQDGSALLIVEVSRYRVIRYELTAPDRGIVSVFADRLPGIPDDVFVDPQGDVWITLVAQRAPFMDDWIAPHPYLARIISSLPWSFQNTIMAIGNDGGRIVKLSEDGAPECTLIIPEGPPPANGLFHNGNILLGRLGGTELISIDLNACGPRKGTVSRKSLEATDPLP